MKDLILKEFTIHPRKSEIHCKDCGRNSLPYYFTNPNNEKVCLECLTKIYAFIPQRSQT